MGAARGGPGGRGRKRTAEEGQRRRSEHDVALTQPPVQLRCRLEPAPHLCPATSTPRTPDAAHDDDVASASSKLVLGLTDAFRNPNGCRLPATW